MWFDLKKTYFIFIIDSFFSTFILFSGKYFLSSWTTTSRLDKVEQWETNQAARLVFFSTISRLNPCSSVLGFLSLQNRTYWDHVSLLKSLKKRTFFFFKLYKDIFFEMWHSGKYPPPQKKISFFITLF